MSIGPHCWRFVLCADQVADLAYGGKDIMKAWLWDGSQGISHLGLAETPNPVAKDGEAVMEVHYTALNPAYMAETVYLYPVYPPMPHVLGRDGTRRLDLLSNSPRGRLEPGCRSALRIFPNDLDIGTADSASESIICGVSFSTGAP